MLHLILAVGLAAAASPAVDGLLASEAVEGSYAASGVPIWGSDARWDGVPSKTFVAYPQQSVRLNDRRANELIPSRAVTPVSVQALYDDAEIAVRLRWADATENRVSGDSAAFGDTVAMELPQTFGQGTRLPYVGMGDTKQKVTVYMWRAIPDGSQGREYVGAGFGSLTRSLRAGLKGDLTYDAASRMWTAVFVRPLVMGPQSLKAGLVPIAFAVWDGSRNERGGNKALTSWKFIRLDRFPRNTAYDEEMAWGYGPDDLGDVALGKVLVESMCVACHWVGEKRLAAPEVAPDLSGVGGIATYGYLRDSILAPSEVVVPHLNINRHYNRSAEPDRYRAYPNQDANAFGGGPPDARVSKMPPFPLPPAQVGAMVAFLKTLKHEPKPEASLEVKPDAEAEPVTASRETP